MKNKKNVILLVLAFLLFLIILLILLLAPKKYEVTFDTKGGSIIQPIKVKKGDTLVLPENPTKEGYVFLNWVDEEDNTILDNFKVTKNKKLTAIYEKAKEKNVEVTSISLNSKNFDLFVGDSKTLEVTIVPDNATDKNVKWSSNNPKVAVVNQLGKVTAKSVGKATITVKTANGKTASVIVNCKAKPAPKNVDVTGISLTTKNLDLIIKESGNLKATITPANATNKSIKWSSSDSDIISVDNKGKVTANKIGKATITAKTANGKTATAIVYSDVKSIKLKLDHKYISKYGNGIKKAILTAEITPNVELDSSLYKWDNPDLYGENSIAYVDPNSTYNRRIIVARNVWSINESAPIKLTIGRKTSSPIRIYVECELNVTPSTIEVYRKDDVAITSNIDVTWDGIPRDAENIEETSKSLKFTAKSRDQFTIKATSNAGQTKDISIKVKEKPVH